MHDDLVKREPKLILTEDGSHTIYIPDLKESYHSVKGAIKESRHVFIEAGFMQVPGDIVNIFELGFGTGLNALLTYDIAKRSKRKVVYHTVEKYPLSEIHVRDLNYPNQLGKDTGDIFLRLHEIPWEKEVEISDFFVLKKINADFKKYNFTSSYNLVYFDAFAPEVQPDMWQKGIFGKIFQSMRPGGILTTYSSKGAVRRTMKSVGFIVEKLPGPPGKWEMVRARVPDL